ncbi:CBS domain-containing protein [Pseudonocardia sp. RS11V-5]|uniref:CBS domain-containing protein n=1 Tax=Pseudonocardia terrae TaxID=2905831 RepID=UPI001E2C24AD|nr:CBS domain-containing protein [Pseudonocardia terrae]MCE3553127.1 CBS domain-containing protein [Pseudonocardia terrae]
MLTRDVMTRDVVTVRPQATVREVARLLAARGFTALPVVDEHNELLGIVTEADLLAGRLRHDARSPLLAAELSTGPPAALIGEVMTTEVVTALPWTDAADLVEDMTTRGIRSVPVVEPGRGLVGIVSRRDVLGAVGRPDDRIEHAVRRGLRNYAGRDRWGVSVRDGVVTLAEDDGDPTERHIAMVIAQNVAGVVDVRVVPAGE